MAEITFEQILQAAQQLPPSQKDELIRQLQGEPLTRARLIRDLEERRKAGAFRNATSLKGKFVGRGAHPDADEVDHYLRSLNDGWEDDLGGLPG